MRNGVIALETFSLIYIESAFGKVTDKYLKSELTIRFYTFITSFLTRNSISRYTGSQSVSNNLGAIILYLETAHYQCLFLLLLHHQFESQNQRSSKSNALLTDF
jgi:hypothetical protein